MRKVTNLGAVAALTIAVTALFSGGTLAQNTRSFVSGHGADTNPCTLAAPCRSFAQAVLSTVAGGEIAVLDTAGYGPVTISQSLSIVNPGGVEAGIAVPSGGTGILITGGSVALRGLTLEGAGIGQDGIKLTGGSRLEIVNCVIRDFIHDGIYVNHNTGTVTLSISNTISSDNGLQGIDIGPATGDGTASVIGNINQSLTNNNGQDGIVVYGLNGARALQITISDGVSDSNDVGLAIFSNNSNVTVTSSFTTLSNNTGIGVTNSGGIVRLFKNTVNYNCVFCSPNGENDVNNAALATMYLYNNNIIVFSNFGGAVVDGSNDIQTLRGLPPIKQNPT